MKKQLREKTSFSQHSSLVKPLELALLITIFYLVIGMVYIFFSGLIAVEMAQTMEELADIERIKGKLYIVVTGLLLFTFAFFLFKRIAHNESDIIAYREVLIEAERRATAGLFAASVAHDINNVLMVIDHMTERLHELERPENKQILEKLEEAHYKLYTMVKHLEEATGKSLGEKIETFDLIEIIDETIRFAQNHKKVKHCHLKLSSPEKLIFTGKPVFIHQMLFNLIINAADATEYKGTILIEVEDLKNKVQILVHDDGPGIPEELQENILEPFVTTKEDGSGLGLISVKAAAEAHNGRVIFGSSKLGGTCFDILLKKLRVE